MSDKLQPQIPAEGIMQTHKFKDSVFYSVNCSCGSDDHTIDISISYEKDYNDIVVEFYSKQKSLYWKKVADWDIYKIDNSWLFSIVYFIQGFINGLGHRLKVTKDLWWNGYIEYQSDTIMSKQTALNMAEAIKNAIEELENEKSSDQ